MRKTKKVCIVIPIYKELPSRNELNSLKRLLDLYEKHYDIFLVGPNSIDTKTYQIGANQLPLIGKNPKFFKSVFTYNFLMLNPGLYKHFLTYQYLLVYQLDAFILSDRLEEICSWGYDYIGAPWLNGGWINMMDQKKGTSFFSDFFLKVGNGGFSLRNIKKFYWISVFFSPFIFLWKAKWNEDIFWSTICYRFVPGYKVAPVDKALEFSIEDQPERSMEKLNGRLPFGCHAWEKHNPSFWNSIFKELGYEMVI